MDSVHLEEMKDTNMVMLKAVVLALLTVVASSAVAVETAQRR